MLYEIGGLGCCTRYVLHLFDCVALHSVLLYCVMILVATILSSPYVIFPLSTVCCVGDARTFIHVLGFMLNTTIPILPMMGVGLVCYSCIYCPKRLFGIFGFGVLVGAFSVFGSADTGKPVQIYILFCIFEAFLEN